MNRAGKIALLSLVAWIGPRYGWGQTGFKPIIGGGLPYDSSLSLGVEYKREGLLRSPVDFHGMVVGSWKKYYLMETGLTIQRIGVRWLYAEGVVRLRNYPEEDFWGIGLRSSRARRTTYRYEDLDTLGVIGVRPVKWLKAGLVGGRLDLNSGPGKDADWPSVEERFIPSEAPGLERQSDYFHVGAFVEADRRDVPIDPRRGGFYRFRFTDYLERQSNGLDFQRFEFDARKYLSVWKERTTFAARALSILTATPPGNQVPFYLQPTVGGGADLRGYAQYRFRDQNALLFNLESRWRLNGLVQVVGFGDAGKVFERPGQIGLSGLRGSVGGGGRLLLGTTLMFGVDAGWSPDGFRFWFRGSHTF